MIRTPANDPGASSEPPPRRPSPLAIRQARWRSSVLLGERPEAGATLTPVVAEALIATARAQPDERDRAAQVAYQEAQATRVEIGRLIETALLDDRAPILVAHHRVQRSLIAWDPLATQAT